MKTLNSYISEGGFFKNVGADRIVVNTINELKQLIKKAINEIGKDCDLNFIDVSKINDMSYLFFGSEFVGDISKWDTSNVRDMNSMFANSKFNGDISKWDTSNVTNMASVFEGSKFNGDISGWNVSKVTDMSGMFDGSKLKKIK